MEDSALNCKRSGRRVMEKKLGWVPGFRFTASNWLAYPAFRLTGFQHSNWLASSAPIGHIYTLIYAVMMYSSYTLLSRLCITSLLTFYSLRPPSSPSRSLSSAPSISSYSLSISSPETHDLFSSLSRDVQLDEAFFSLSPNILPLHFITNFSFPLIG